MAAASAPVSASSFGEMTGEELKNWRKTRGLQQQQPSSQVGLPRHYCKPLGKRSQGNSPVVAPRANRT
jgi:hypothetical protein